MDTHASLIQEALNRLGVSATNLTVRRYLLDHHGVSPQEVDSKDILEQKRLLYIRKMGGEVKKEQLPAILRKKTGQRKSLSRRQAQLLREWMTANQEKLLRIRPTFARTAAMASGELGFPISLRTIPRIQHETGVEWRSDDALTMMETMAKIEPKANLPVARVEALEGLLAPLCEEVETLRKLVNHLCESLGRGRPV